MKPVRRALWRSGAPLRALLIGLVRAYRLTLSGWLGGQCRFYPSCSHYAEDAIRLHGVLRGSALAAWRVLRCNPFGRGGIEPVPGEAGYREAYDDVIHRRGERQAA